jgi:hypothetical protein
MRLLPFAAAFTLVFVTLAAHADPPNEMTTARDEIDATLAQMKVVSRRVRDELRDARKHGSSTQVTCLDEALSRADVALRSARTAGDDALAAYARGDLDDARAARHRVAELREHQRIAARDGAACTPRKPVIVAMQGTTVRVVVDPKIAPAPVP